MKIFKKQKGLKLMMILLIILVGSATLFSQNGIKKDKLIYHSFSITPIEAFIIEDFEGISISSDLSYAYKKSIFTFSGSLSEEYNILGGGGDRFYQLNILYGREFELQKWLYFDAQTGVGFLFYNDLQSEKQTKVGLPLVAKLRFKTGDIFSIGFKAQVNVNSISKLYTLGLLLQWNID